MTIEDVRTAIADACATIPTWRAQPYVRDQVSAPEIQVGRGRIVYDVVMGTSDGQYFYTVTAFVQRDNERAAQMLLQNLCEPSGDGSLKYILEHDSRIADLVGYIRVLEASEDRQTVIGQISYLVVEFQIEVMA